MFKIKKKVSALTIYFVCFMLNVNAQNAQELLIKAKQALDNNQIQECISLSKQVIDLKYNVSEAYVIMGLAHYAFSDYNKAIDAYTKSIELDNQYKDAYYNRGVAYYWLSKNEQALADFQKAIELDKKDARTYTALGVLYTKLAENEQNKKYIQLAQETYEKAIAVNPKYPSSYYNLALLESDKHPKKALEYLNIYINLKKDADGFLLRGIVYNDLKKFKEAIIDFDEALKLKNYDPQIYSEKAWALLKTSQTQEACKNWKKAQELGSTDVASYLEKYCK
ncbi:MAG: tetratricopeptide repeat protein [Raineya sp.]|jgi:tetratricopeptide (TPR) repeat protein|nr:tetratricopeptide repeat protein [Raineya sp.]